MTKIKFVRKNSSYYIDIFTFFVLAFAGAFKFIEPFIYSIDNRNTYFMMILLVLTGLVSLLKSNGTKKLNYIIVALIIGCITLVMTDMGLAYSICVGVILSQVPMKKGLKVFLLAGLIFMFIDIFAGEVLGFNKEFFVVNDNGEIRHTLGFDHPNSLPTWYLILVAGFLIIIKKNKLLRFFLLGIVAFYIYSLTISRTFILSLIIMLIAYFPIKRISKSKKFYILIPLIFIFFTIGSFLLGTIFNTQSFNELLSGRPLYYNLYISNGTIAWVSGLFVSYPSDWWLDNYFLYLIYRTSAILFLCLSIGYIYLFIKAKTYCTKSTFFRVSLSFTLLMVGSVTGAFLIQTYNPTLIVLISVLISNKSCIRVLYFEGENNEKKIIKINKRQFKTSI